MNGINYGVNLKYTKPSINMVSPSLKFYTNDGEQNRLLLSIDPTPTGFSVEIPPNITIEQAASEFINILKEKLQTATLVNKEPIANALEIEYITRMRVVIVDIIEERIETINDWMQKNALECFTDSKENVKGSIEKKYFQYGYLSALKDAKNVFLGSNITTH